MGDYTSNLAASMFRTKDLYCSMIRKLNNMYRMAYQRPAWLAKKRKARKHHG